MEMIHHEKDKNHKNNILEHSLNIEVENNKIRNKVNSEYIFTNSSIHSNETSTFSTKHNNRSRSKTISIKRKKSKSSHKKQKHKSKKSSYKHRSKSGNKYKSKSRSRSRKRSDKRGDRTKSHSLSDSKEKVVKDRDYFAKTRRVERKRSKSNSALRVMKVYF